MKRFFLNLLFFFLVFLAVNVMAFFVLARPTIMKDYVLPGKQLKKYHRFLMADSHGKAIRQCDLDAAGICNFSYDSDSYYDMLVKVNYLINNFQVDTIFLTVDDHTLSKYREKWTNRRRSIYYSTPGVYTRFYKISRVEFFFKKYFEYYTPLFSTGNAKVFRAYIESKISGKELPNYENFDISKEAASLPGRSKERVEMQYPSDQPSGFLQGCLAELVKLCRENSVEIVGIKFPLTDAFISELGGRSFHADRFLKEKGYPVIDLKNSLSNHTSYFRDQDHLNYTGSKHFVDLLKEQL